MAQFQSRGGGTDAAVNAEARVVSSASVATGAVSRFVRERHFLTAGMLTTF